MAVASYDAQLQIRRDAEEHSAAHRDLGSWVDQMKNKSTKPNQRQKQNDGNAAAKKNDITLYSCDRLQGNSYFAQGKYEDAIQCYTRSLGKKGALTSPLVYSNRAMAHLKLKSWAQAEADATSALQIDPHHFKSYQRRCTARLAMGKVRAAMVDVCAAEDCAALAGEEEGRDGSAAAAASLAEVRKLRTKVEKALADAARRAPRRKLHVTVVS